ncbi:hypothetical protein NF047_000672 [Salmonella enterica]|nr:hypothetical protein [Salmonella enterica subsp. enterica]EJH6838029.1 hypothetical protein [Salmonella enterica]EJI5528226.1 hypothetical protein [Salmonella enterica]
MDTQNHSGRIGTAGEYVPGVRRQRTTGAMTRSHPRSEENVYKGFSIPEYR